jgi:hypothetical protein
VTAFTPYRAIWLGLAIIAIYVIVAVALGI